MCIGVLKKESQLTIVVPWYLDRHLAQSPRRQGSINFESPVFESSNFRNIDRTLDHV